MKISVKVGSNQLKLNITKNTNCSDLIRMALLQCKIGKPIAQKRFFFKSFNTVQLNESITRNYGLFERAIGIERQIGHDENISQLWYKWNSSEQDSQMQFVIKLCPTKSKLIVHKIQTNYQNSQRLFNQYKKQLKNLNSLDAEHEYETIENVSYRQLVNKSPTSTSVTYSIDSYGSDEKPLLNLDL